MNRHLSGGVRTGRLAASLAAALLTASLLPVAPVSVTLGATTVTPATGGTAISAATAGTGGTGAYTTLAGPVITEGAAGELVNNGEVWLTAPAGFGFDASAGTAEPGGTGCAGLTVDAPVRSTSLIKVKVTAQSTSPCVLTFSGIRVRPTNASPLVTGNITNTGSAGPTGSTNYGTLTMVVGDPAKLAFTQQPSTSPSGVAFLTQPKVAIQDAVGNTITTDNASKVTLALVGAGGSLTGCTAAVTVSAGVATFGGCIVTGAGIGYKLTATDTTGGAGHPYTAATSASFDIPDNLGFETQPGVGAGAGSTAQGGVAFTNQPKVTVRLGISNFNTRSANDATTLVTLGIRSGTGTAGAVLTCDAAAGQPANTMKVTAGSAQFTGCRIDRSGTGYQLVATSVPGYGVGVWYSNAFNVVAGPATKLAFITQPAGASAGQVFTTQPVVAITDAGGNIATSGVRANVTLGIGTNPGVPPGVLSCSAITVATATSGANAGQAAFSGCRISNAGVGYTLTATATGIVGATSLAQGISNAFTVGAPAAQISLTRSSSTITWGQGVVLTTQFLVNGAGKTFTLQAARDGVTWSTIATLTTDASGKSVYAYRPPTNAYYRAVFAGTSDLQAATSAAVRTVVRQVSFLRPTNGGATKSISRNTSVTFTATVRPSRPELVKPKVTFFFYRLSGSTWVLSTKRDVQADLAGQARTTFKFTSSGQWYVRSQANPTPYNANSVMTPPERYSVR
jgi:trimeric autotransporter adhesin